MVSAINVCPVLTGVEPIIATYSTETDHVVEEQDHVMVWEDELKYFLLCGRGTFLYHHLHYAFKSLFFIYVLCRSISNLFHVILGTLHRTFTGQGSGHYNNQPWCFSLLLCFGRLCQIHSNINKILLFLFHRLPVLFSDAVRGAWVTVCPVPPRTESVSTPPACPLDFPRVLVSLHRGRIPSVQEAEEPQSLNIKQNLVQ